MTAPALRYTQSIRSRKEGYYGDTMKVRDTQTSSCIFLSRIISCASPSRLDWTPTVGWKCFTIYPSRSSRSCCITAHHQDCASPLPCLLHFRARTAWLSPSATCHSCRRINKLTFYAPSRPFAGRSRERRRRRLMSQSVPNPLSRSFLQKRYVHCILATESPCVALEGRRRPASLHCTCAFLSLGTMSESGPCEVGHLAFESLLQPAPALRPIRGTFDPGPRWRTK